jgi:ribosomal-protein-alanine N-acetyltransferase
MSEIILETPRLALVMWGAGDAALIQSLHSSFDTTQYLSGAAPWGLEKAGERLQTWFDEQKRDGITKYKLLRREDGAFVGRAGFSLLERSGEYELGYSMCREAWGNGYATEIAAALARWFFETNLSDRFTAFTHPDNLASQRVLTKIGMLPCAPVIVDDILCPTFEMVR